MRRTVQQVLLLLRLRRRWQRYTAARRVRLPHHGPLRCAGASGQQWGRRGLGRRPRVSDSTSIAPARVATGEAAAAAAAARCRRGRRYLTFC